jgi:hypothetical protein
MTFLGGLAGACVLACSLVAACTQLGDPASPAPIAGEDAAVDVGAVLDASYAFCPDSVDASFGSLATNLFGSMQGCVSICHITIRLPDGTQVPAPMNGDLAFDQSPASIYAQLLGPDGGGRIASNEAGTDRTILRVAPFDPDASLLYIKLNLHTFADPRYGSGMPGNTPGSVCPPAIEAVHDWIAQGAPPAEAPAAGADAGDGGTSASDAEAGASEAGLGD